MSAPEATGTRQRTTKEPVQEEEVKTKNPSSLSTNSDKRDSVARKKPIVKPPFADVSMGRFLTYLVLGLSLIAAFYTWRFTVWAAEVGGYWNLVTGHRSPPATGPGEAALHAAASAASKGQASYSSATARSSGTAAVGGTGKKGSKGDVQSQIYELANALGVKPADLSNAIRPLIDPSVPNPAEAARAEADILKAKVAAQGGAASDEAQKNEGPGLLAAMGEAFLD